MQMVRKIFLVFLTAAIALVLFAPKRELYYLLQKKLQQEGIVLDQRQLAEKPFGLDLKGVKLYWHGLNLGSFDELEVRTYLVYNRIEGQVFKISPAMQRFVKLSIKDLKIQYRLWDPLHLLIDAEGSFGHIHGLYDLKGKILRLHWIRVGKIENLRPYLKRDKEGWYYERKF